MQERKFPKERLPLRKGGTLQADNVAENNMKEEKNSFFFRASPFLPSRSLQPYIALLYTAVDSSVYFLLSQRHQKAFDVVQGCR